MSNSLQSTNPNGTAPSTTVPAAVVHKQILEAAERRPTASIETLAADVSGATAELVQRVLDRYGDPIDESHDAGGGSDGDQSEPSTDVTQRPSGEDPAERPAPERIRRQLTENQRRALRAIYRNPHATQRELATVFDVSSATINRWVNGIDGFDWSDRYAFAAAILDPDDRSIDDGAAAPGEESPGRDRERRLRTDPEPTARDEATPAAVALLADLDRAHAILRACMKSGEVDEADERALLRAIASARSAE